METKVTLTGGFDQDGVPTAIMDMSFEVVVEAEGHRREDGLTAAQVRQEIKEREAIDGS